MKKETKLSLWCFAYFTVASLAYFMEKDLWFAVSIITGNIYLAASILAEKEP